MAEELTQEEIDKLLAKDAQLAETGSKTLGTTLEKKSMVGVLASKDRKRRVNRASPRSRIMADLVPYRGAIVIRSRTGDYLADAQSLIESPLMNYALFTFGLGGGIRESRNSFSGNLIRRLCETDHYKFASSETQNILVAKLIGEQIFKGVYRVFKSDLRSYGSPLYETRTICEVSEGDEPGFVKGLELGVKSCDSHYPGVIYVQKELKEELTKILEDLDIGITLEADLGSLAREKRR